MVRTFPSPSSLVICAFQFSSVSFPARSVKNSSIVGLVVQACGLKVVMQYGEMAFMHQMTNAMLPIVMDN